MAALHSKHFLSIIYNFSSVWWRDGFRLYSVYPKNFEEPVFKLKDIENLMEEEPKEKLEVTSRKAAKSSQTCSVFYDPQIERFTNFIMRKGRRNLARTLVESAFTKVKHTQLRKYNEEKDQEKKKEIIINPLEVFYLAVKNTTPSLTVRKLKRSGTWYRVPTGITREKAELVAQRWIVEAAKDKKNTRPFEDQLAVELIDAANATGKAYQRKVELHKLCEANRGYAHYKWG